VKKLSLGWLGCALVSLLVGCGGEGNSLRGSIDQSFSLEFDEVRIRKQGTDLLIEYLKNVGPTPAKVCKIIIQTENLTGLKSNSRIEGEQFIEYVSIQREAQTQGDFPALQSGARGGLRRVRVQGQRNHLGRVRGVLRQRSDDQRDVRGRGRRDQLGVTPPS
jgi:hypothetical protein